LFFPPYYHIFSHDLAFQQTVPDITSSSSPTPQHMPATASFPRVFIAPPPRFSLEFPLRVVLVSRDVAGKRRLLNEIGLAAALVAHIPASHLAHVTVLAPLSRIFGFRVVVDSYTNSPFLFMGFQAQRTKTWGPGSAFKRRQTKTTKCAYKHRQLHPLTYSSAFMVG
jgi:hypothetical protein